FAGNWLNTGLGAFWRMTITPSTWLRVSPTMFRRPPERLNSPITPRIGIDSPIRASAVRTGRVKRFRQANRPMWRRPLDCPARSGPLPPRGGGFGWGASVTGHAPDPPPRPSPTKGGGGPFGGFGGRVSGVAPRPGRRQPRQPVATS